MLKVVCFKWQFQGGYKLPSSINNQYTAEHVNRLERMVEENLTLPYEFICITDNPAGVNCRTIPLWDKCRELGGCYNRLYVFSEDMQHLIGERFVCIDLDCVITGSLDGMFSRTEDFIINTYKGFRKNREQYYNGGLFLMTAGARKQVWERWEQGGLEELEAVRRPKQLVGTDQAWISHVLGRGECLFDEDDGVYNYRHISNKRELPLDARIVFFAGALDPSMERGIGWINQYYFFRRHFNTADDSIARINNVTRKLVNETRQAARALGYAPNIISPQSFNEKILWLKFFKPDRLKQVTSDTLLAKRYAQRQGIPVEVLPVLDHKADAKELEFETYERPFRIRSNHRRGVIREVDNGHAPSWVLLQRECQTWLNGTDEAFKYPFTRRGIRPQLLVESLMMNEDGSEAERYELYMMNGKCCLVGVVSGEGRRFYTPAWRALDVSIGDKPLANVTRRSKAWLPMKRSAEKLSKSFDFVRVDFDVTDRGAYFYDLDFFPAFGHLGFSDLDFDFELGTQLTLNI